MCIKTTDGIILIQPISTQFFSFGQEFAEYYYSIKERQIHYKRIFLGKHSFQLYRKIFVNGVIVRIFILFFILHLYFLAWNENFYGHILFKLSAPFIIQSWTKYK